MFIPTDEQRRTVRALSGYGVPHEGIAIHIGIDAKTLRKHFQVRARPGIRRGHPRQRVR